MCVFIYIYIYIYIYSYMCVNLRVYTCIHREVIHTCIYIYIYVCVCVCVCVFACIYMHPQGGHTYIQTHIHTLAIWSDKYISTGRHIHTCIHTYIHTCIRGESGKSLAIVNMKAQRWPYGISDTSTGRPLWNSLQILSMSYNGTYTYMCVCVVIHLQGGLYGTHYRF